jgi:hypothetical protein
MSSDSKNISRKLIMTLIKKYGPMTIGALVKKYKKLKTDTAFSDVRAAVSQMATEEDAPPLTIVQFQTPGEDKFNWMIFQAGTEFVFPETSSANEDPDLDALSGMMQDPPVPDLPLATDLLTGYFVVVESGDTIGISFMEDAVSACSKAIVETAANGREAVMVYGAVPVRLDVTAFLDRNGDLTPLVDAKEISESNVVSLQNSSQSANKQNSQAAATSTIQV